MVSVHILNDILKQMLDSRGYVSCSLIILQLKNSLLLCWFEVSKFLLLQFHVKKSRAASYHNQKKKKKGQESKSNRYDQLMFRVYMKMSLFS